MPTSAVVDASVLVNAFLFPGSVPGRIVRLAGQGRFAVHLSPLLLDETRTALLSARLTDAYGHTEEAVSIWCGTLQDAGIVFTGALPDIGPACRDPTDDHVIATAIVTGVGHIVTDDKDLLALGQFRTVIRTPADQLG